MALTSVIATSSDHIYQYLNFDKVEEYKAVADTVAAA